MTNLTSQFLVCPPEVAFDRDQIQKCKMHFWATCCIGSIKMTIIVLIYRLSLIFLANKKRSFKSTFKAVAIQMYNVKHEMVPEYIEELFSRGESNYDIRDNDLFEIPRFESITYGKKSFRYYGAKLWANLPKEIKEKASLISFKSALTSWLLNNDNLRNI